MPNVLEETTAQEIDADHVERRVSDWLGRIDALYTAISEWLPAGWTSSQTGTVRMSEELMERHGVAERQMPILTLAYHGKPSATIEPRGLWIIGANGRLDLRSSSGHYVIVDLAENFEQPKWHIAPLSDRRKMRPLDPSAFEQALA